MSNSFWKEKRVLVTGCNGFLGSWLTAGLVEAQSDVVGIIRDWVPHSLLAQLGLRNRMTIVNGDVCDYELMERVLAEYEIEIIFHLAAQTIVGIANISPLSTFETNIKGTWVLLEAARRNTTVKGIIVASSDKAYGAQEKLPYQENAPLMARHPYDVSKSCADMIARAYAHSYGTPAVVTRFSNLYGGGDLNWNRIVPGTIRSIVQGNQPVIRSDGSPKRDYLYVEDAVSGYMTLGEHIGDEDLHGLAFNFGMDQPVTALQMVNTICHISGQSNLKPIILNQAKNEIPDQYLASSRAHKKLGWHPEYSLEDGLVRTMAWYSDFLALSQ
ncbi:MAG TPA: GDP-mannose 4,6-dehydratase [Patescibacteria group bacterium]|nr:GDP-mannose 4,6-dehydratase [Patescibacteria group bacterium]